MCVVHSYMDLYVCMYVRMLFTHLHVYVFMCPCMLYTHIHVCKCMHDYCKCTYTHTVCTVAWSWNGCMYHPSAGYMENRRIGKGRMEFTPSIHSSTAGR